MVDEQRLESLCEQAEAALENAQPEAARDLMEEALALSPRFGPALLLKIEALFALGEVDDALAAADDCAQLVADDPRALVRLADLLILGNGEDPEVVRTALSHLAQAQRASLRLTDPLLHSDLERSRGQALLALDDLPGAAQALERARELAGDAADDDLLVELAMIWFETLRFSEAAALLKSVLNRDPEHADAVHYLGLLAERQGDQRQAQELFERAREIDPESYPEPVSVTDVELQEAITRAKAALPPRVGEFLDAARIAVEPLPPLELLKGPPALSPLATAITREPSGSPAAQPGTIHLYRQNLVRYCADRDELDDEIAATLLHEAIHAPGWSDDEPYEHGLH